MTSLKFAFTQIEEILQHSELSNVIHNISAKAIRSNMRPNFSIDHEIITPITNVLPEGFLISDAPAPIENYLKLSKDIFWYVEKNFLTTYNISKGDTDDKYNIKT